MNTLSDSRIKFTEKPFLPSVRIYIIKDDNTIKSFVLIIIKYLKLLQNKEVFSLFMKKR